ACSGHVPSLFAENMGEITILSDLQTGSPCPASNGTGSTESASTGCQANITPDSPRTAPTRVVNPKGRRISRVPNPFRYHFTGDAAHQEPSPAALWLMMPSLALLWQIYSRRCSLQIHFWRCGHRCGGSRAISSRMAWRTAGRVG